MESVCNSIKSERSRDFTWKFTNIHLVVFLRLPPGPPFRSVFVQVVFQLFRFDVSLAAVLAEIRLLTAVDHPQMSEEIIDAFHLRKREVINFVK